MGDASGLDYLSGSEHPERRLAAIATAQHGVVSRAQLLAAGLSPRAIQRRLEAGRLLRRHRGVYAVGHQRLTERGRWMAAVLAAGDGASLSHRSAARLWGLRAGEGRIEVTAPKDRRRDGLKIYVAALPSDEVTRCDGIPTTTAARTLLDLASVEPPHKVERALRG